MDILELRNVSFTYDADGMRRSKTVGGVTHYYTYDGIQLVKEKWGNNVMIFLYDALGAPVGMQYRNSTYAEDVWDIYYYEKNLQGDIVAVYNSAGTKLVSYDYDAWGYISCVTYSNGGASTSVVHNPLRYRGYYYDDDLDLYYLATRYYDPEVCRFITADSYVSTGQGILGHNMYVYCRNNPVNFVDYTGEMELLLGWSTIMGSIAVIEPTIIGEVLFVVGIVIIVLTGKVEPVYYDNITLDDVNTSESMTQESSVLTSDTLEITKSDSYDPNPYGRPGEKKQNRENRSKSRTKQGWEPRNNRRDGKPAKPKSHTPSKKGHKKYFVVSIR